MGKYRQPRSPLEGVDHKARRECQEAPRQHEEETAAALGGRRQRGSGCAEFRKGDVTGIGAAHFDFLTECKMTQGVSMRLQARWLNKITTEAFAVQCEPMLAIRFGHDVLASLATDGSKVADSNWVAVPQRVMEQLLACVREGEVDEG